MVISKHAQVMVVIEAVVVSAWHVPLMAGDVQLCLDDWLCLYVPSSKG